MFRHSETPLQLTICSNLKFVITHEFGHAWIDVHLSRERRDDYAQERGFDTWNGKEAEWGDRAVEDAAFTMQKNLMLIGQGSNSPAVLDRIGAYQLLTGQPSPLRQS